MNMENKSCYSQSPKWGAVVQDSYRHPHYHIGLSDGRFSGGIDVVHMNHIVFGNALVSMPFSDVGGFCVNNQAVEQKLFSALMVLAARCKTRTVELRMDREIHWLNSDWIRNQGSVMHSHVSVSAHKVKMILDLPPTSDDLMNGFKSKLRSQIRRPIKDGMTARIGKKELLDDFYSVFAVNMRDLGSPVHSRQFFKNVLHHFHGISDVMIVYDKFMKPVAGSIVVGIGKCLSNPWASSLKEYRASSPNMLLYWTMLKYGIENGFSLFDFGRSTPGEGTHIFKEQWGAKALPLYWYSITRENAPVKRPGKDNTGFDMISKLWQRLPVCIANYFGPYLRKDISL